MSTYYNLDHLPDSVLALSGYDFYQFVRNTLGEPEADLLKKISIQTTSSFLLIEDPLEIFNHDIDDEELEELKGKLCFKLKNKKMLIKPGVISGFHSLREALKAKVDEQLTQSKKKQQRQKQSSIINSLCAPLPLMLAPTIQSTSTSQSTSIKKFSLSQHREHVKKLISKWCSENGDHFGVEDFQLSEDVDFTLNIVFDENLNVKGNIKCKCNKLISLANNDDKLQVSNYYKHLQSFGCDHMKTIRKNARNSRPGEQLQPSSPSILLVPSQQSHSSSIQVASTTPITTETLTRTKSPVTSNESIRAGKRRFVTQSKQTNSAKRSRS